MASASATSGGWGVRLSVFFGALFLIHGVNLTYLPVWLEGRGLSPAEIGLASSAPMLMRIAVTPAVAFMADRAALHREIIIAACVGALLLMVALHSAGSVLVVIVLVVLVQMALQTVMPLADTVTMAAVKERGLDYGRIRLWGSLTFILASYVAGWAVAREGAEAVLYLTIAAAGLTVAAAIWLPRAEASRGPRLTLADAVELVKGRTFLLFLVTAGAIQASHAVLYVFGVIHWRSQGLSAGYIATLWAISVLAEIALFWAARWLQGFGPVRLMMLGAAAGLVRWLAMAFDPAPYWLVPLQILHGGTFAASHLGAMLWIGARVPAATAGTAQALLSTFTAGIAMSAAMLVSGVLYEAFAGRAYLAMVVACGLGLVAGLALARLERRGAT